METKVATDLQGSDKQRRTSRHADSLDTRASDQGSGDSETQRERPLQRRKRKSELSDSPPDFLLSNLSPSFPLLTSNSSCRRATRDVSCIASALREGPSDGTSVDGGKRNDEEDEDEEERDGGFHGGGWWRDQNQDPRFESRTIQKS